MMPLSKLDDRPSSSVISKHQARENQSSLASDTVA